MTAAAAILALFLAHCFARLGELLLGRDSGDVLAWNESLLVGMSVFSLLFFPLSLVLPGSALRAALGLLIGCGFWRARVALSRTLRLFGAFLRPTHSGIVPFGLLLLVVLMFVQFTAHNLRLSYLWDGFQIWASKALVIYSDGALGRSWLAPGEQRRLLAYPPMVPLYGAFVAELRGKFDWNALKPIFCVFYLSLLLSTYSAARSRVSRSVSLGSTALLAMLPSVSTRFSIGGYADMPQAALVAAVVAAGLRCRSGALRWRDPLPWLICGTMLVKSEGMILACIACLTLAALWVMWARCTVSRISVRPYLGGAMVIALGFVLRWMYVLWLRVDDLTYGPLDRAHLVRAFENGLLVVRMCAQRLFDVTEWGVFWPVFLLSALVITVVGRRRERGVVFATVAGIAAYTSIFYFTNWDIALHIDQAYSRLLVQLAPAASVSIGVAYAYMMGQRSEVEA